MRNGMMMVAVGLMACEANEPSWIALAPEAELARECAAPDARLDRPSRVGSWGANLGLTFDDVDVAEWTACWRYMPAASGADAVAQLTLVPSDLSEALGDELDVRIDAQQMWDVHAEVGEGTLDFEVNGEPVMSIAGDFSPPR